MCPEAFSQLYQTQIKGQQDDICSPDNPYRSLVPEPIVPKEPGIEYYSFLDSLGFDSPDFLLCLDSVQRRPFPDTHIHEIGA